MPDYLPFAQRRISTEYRDMLAAIRDTGTRVPTKQGVDALALAGCQMRFPMRHGAAVITERAIGGFAPKAIGELCAFINGARTLEELAEFGCDWWGPWATEEKCTSRGLATGDLGPGSYGHAFRHFTTDLEGRADGESGHGEPGFDQFAHLVRKLRDLPEDRTAVVSPWIPQANHRARGVKSRNTIAPCHGWVHALVLGGKLHLVHNQRSGDTPIGVPSNMVQYTALGLMLEQLTSYEFVEYVHWIQYAHIYVNQLEHVDELLAREPRRLPTLRLTEAGRRVSDIHDFRGEHFEIADYDPHPAIRDIPVLT
ncbi:MAG TPA: thymidylate synthase [Solirubrobacteraceae bacterium]|jgi:thymidylate synthase|nr:thymidylate synthase [Solirubrobacteraceae bacterium]